MHPRLTPVGQTIGGTTSQWLMQIGPYGTWGDLAYTTRWGDGACGMFEASWTMPLPPDFTHPLLRRGTIVELMDGPYRVGSPLIMSEPGIGSNLDDPWQITCSGIGREVEGQDSFYALDGSGNTTNDPTVAIDQAIARGLRWGGRDASVPVGAFGTDAPLQSVGSLLGSVCDFYTKRWGIGQDNLVRLMADPSTPTYQTTPAAVVLGTADDDYATVVIVRYLDSGTSTYKTVFAPASASAVEQTFGRKEYPVDVTSIGAMSTGTAQSFADGILAKSKGRLAYTNSLTLTSNELLTSGGTPASLSKVVEDVGSGCMVRLHGISNDLLAFNGQTWLDIIIGQAKLTDGEQAVQAVQLDPIGLAARDLSKIIEEVTGMAAS